MRWLLAIAFLFVLSIPAQAQTYYHTTSAVSSGDPFQVFFNGTRLTQVATQGALVTGGWWWDSSNSFIWIFDNPSGNTVTASVRNNCITLTGQTYITLTGLDCEGALQNGIYNNGVATGLTINGVISSNNVLDGVNVSTPANLGTPLNSLLVENSTMEFNGEHGYISEGYTPSELVQSNTIDHNCQGYDAGFSSFCGGLRAISNDPPPVRATNVIFQYNLVYQNGLTGDNRGDGIWFDTMGSGSQIRYNVAWGNGYNQIVLENTSDTADTSSASQAIYGNLVYNCASFVSFTTGIELYRQSKYNVIANNTIYGCGYNIQISGLSGGSDPVGMINNVISNNISFGWGLQALLAQWGGENDGVNGSGNTYTFNALGVAASNFIGWGSSTNESAYTAWENASGSCGSTGCSHSVQTNPNLTNPSTGVLTLQAGSPAIRAGTNLGATYQASLLPVSKWPNGVLVGNQGSKWNIGAYLSSGGNALWFGLP